MTDRVSVLDISGWLPESSEIDWCEPNYVYTDKVAEFWNTLSNLPFFFIAPVGMYLTIPYSMKVDCDINFCWVCLFLVGMGSTYFHGTLSLGGQLLDEIAIMWVLVAMFSVFLPPHKFRWFIRSNRRKLKIILTLTASVGTGMAFIYPVLNAFLLMGVSVPAVQLYLELLAQTQSRTCRRVARVNLVIWALAMTAWINDRFMCKYWSSRQSFSYPQFHAWWHVLIATASWFGMSTFAFLQCERLYAHLQPKLVVLPREWMTSHYGLGIPILLIDPDEEGALHKDDPNVSSIVQVVLRSARSTKQLPMTRSEDGSSSEDSSCAHTIPDRHVNITELSVPPVDESVDTVVTATRSRNPSSSPVKGGARPRTPRYFTRSEAKAT